MPSGHLPEPGPEVRGGAHEPRHRRHHRRDV